MHIHTKFSDGKMSVKEVVKEALLKNLGGIAITDHDTLRGGKTLLNYVKNSELSSKIVAIAGAEISTNYAHVLIYNVDRIPKFETVLELIDKVHEENGLTVFAHPYGNLFFFKYPLVSEDEVLRKIDAIECVNGRVPRRSNLKAYRLAVKYGKPCIGGSDAHIPEEVGSAYTIVRSEINSPDDLLDAILKSRTSASGGRSMLSIVKTVIVKRLIR